MQLITKKNLADKLSMSVEWIEQAIPKGLIPPPIELDGHPRWSEDEIDQWIKNGCPKMKRKKGHAYVSNRPQWEKASELPDCFELQLTNPNAINVKNFQNLFKIVEEADGIWPRHFNSVASTEFKRWFSNLNTPLQEQAYARLSNWFLTDKEICRNAPLGQAAKEFWKAMFCAVPERRLTDPKRDEKILSDEFKLWWPKQQKCQGLDNMG